ncbi:MAG TPA: SPFH domain-containing protein [Phycisphaerae bacterium]|nr:SPFH domain-containing protein [Phycisphaerae bacterium]
MQASKRGLGVAAGGLALQIVLVALAIGLRLTTASIEAMPLIWLALAPVAVWLVTALLFYCRYLQRREAEELRELTARGGADNRLFVEDGQPLPAERRLERLQRSFVPVFTLILAGFHVGIGAWMIYAVGAAEVLPVKAYTAIFFAAGGAFAAFLFSRYAMGMARTEGWAWLRAPGSYLFVNALALFAVAVVLGLEYADTAEAGIPGALGKAGEVAGYVFAAILIVVGVELVLNFVLDLYRPRVPGAPRRFSYDSRLLNLAASPERISHSIAEAINYQFGFEVSSTWFYKLLQRALIPLAIAGALVIWLLTAVVVIEEGQVAVVLRWGRPDPQRRVLQPRSRPYFVWPWPVDKVRRFDTSRVREVRLGEGAVREDEAARNRRVLLWIEEHGQREELSCYVSRPRTADARGAAEAPAVDIIKLVVAVHYRIADPYRFGYDFADPEEVLKAAAHREMVRYAALATLDQKLPAGASSVRREAIISFGRGKAQDDLLERIRTVATELDLGVTIDDVQIVSCHPPSEAAGAFEEVIAAEREQEQLRYQAQAHARKVLTAAAGNQDDALKLAQLISFMHDWEDVANRPPAARAEALDGAIGVTVNEIRKLEEEIALERTLGRSVAEAVSVPAQLLTGCKKHLEDLQAARQDAEKFDLTARLDASRQAVEGRFAGIGGAAAIQIAQARAERWRKAFTERARASSFPARLAAWEASPAVYERERQLDVLKEALSKPRKYVLGIDRDRVEIRLNLEQPQAAYGGLMPGKNQPRP